ncbi:ABC transporter permease [Corallococcus sp. H22C18031201]|uniref:cell division protein FtsX n=1 Tax=Citreicoccus inhibens TaxID=2849499 RepID=UPI000E720FBE|nr:ABC transporter permease [Citreicoccus inhibens]MBU8895938.1 ABC transporter permease [Citreicoccus inhibens]RJS25820.1 ABC transporter permease [Corallococcus sp. H22C18031201]
MSALAKTAYFWRSAAGGLRHSPFVHFIAVSTIAIALFAAGLARGASRVVDNLLSSLGGEVEVTVYLAPELGEDEVHGVHERVQQLHVGDVTVVPPEAALVRLRRELGDLGEALAELPENPLPATLEVRVPAERRSPEALRTLAKELRAQPGVTAVDYGEAAVERLSAIARALRFGALVAFLVVLGTTIIIVAATLQLAIYSRREEIEIQKLVGATDRFVKAPFLLEGLLQGLLGAGLALLGLWTFGRVLGPTLGSLFAFLLGPGVSTAWVEPRTALELVAAGCGLGLGGSFVAVGRFLRV